MTKIIDDVSEYLKDYRILIISKSYSSKIFPKSFLDMKDEIKTRKIEPGLKIDKTDLEILKILSTRARLSLYEIGKLVKLSADAVKYRINKMFKTGLILNYVPIINYSALGYTIYAVLMNINNLSGEKEKALKNFLKGNKNIIWAKKVIGSYNVLMYVCTEKSEELHETLIKIRELFSSDVKDYETLVAYEEYEYTYFPIECSKGLPSTELLH